MNVGQVFSPDSDYESKSRSLVASLKAGWMKRISDVEADKYEKKYFDKIEVTSSEKVIKNDLKVVEMKEDSIIDESFEKVVSPKINYNEEKEENDEVVDEESNEVVEEESNEEIETADDIKSQIVAKSKKTAVKVPKRRKLIKNN
jgi:hypothetical protein